VAEFIGSPAMNLLTVPVVDHHVALGDWSIQLPREISSATEELVVGIRPEHLEVGGTGVEMQIDLVEELGADAYLYGRITNADNALDHSIVVRTDGQDPPPRGSRVRVHPQPAHLHFFAVDGGRLL
jgi:multiple sugar transport system ATP-binding protein